MRRNRIQKAAIPVLLALLLSACSGQETPGKNGKEPAEGTTVTETPAVTAEVTPSISPTEEQIPTVSPTQEPERGHKTPEAIARNRELHEIVKPKRKASPVGTGHVSNGEKNKKKYGLTVNSYTVYASEIDLFTKENANEETQFRSICISGLTNKEAERKINARIEEIALALADYDYIPDYAGILNLVDRYGEPEKKVGAGVAYSGIGYLQVYVTKSWIFKEKKTFRNFGELEEYLENREDFRESWPSYAVVDKDKDAETVTWEISYSVGDGVNVIFNMVTGEEPALSDFFPEGEDYLTYLSDLISEELKYSYWKGEWNGDDYDATREYDATAVFTGLTGEERLNLSVGWSGYNERYGGSIRIDGYEAWIPNVLVPAEGAEYACEECSFYAEPVGSLSVDEPGNTDSSGDIRIQTGNAGEVVVSLRCGDGGMVSGKSEAWIWNENWPPVSVTKEEFLEAARRYLTDNLSLVMDDDYRNCKATVNSCLAYPDGYIFVSLDLCYEDESVSYNAAQFWMKDGKYVPAEELFTISLEEILKLMLTTGAGLSEDKAERAAKNLLPYVKSFQFTPSDIGGGLWSSRFALDKDAIYRGDALWTLLSEDIPAEQLTTLFYGDLYAPVNMIKYLRIYEGFFHEK